MHCESKVGANTAEIIKNIGWAKSEGAVDYSNQMHRLQKPRWSGKNRFQLSNKAMFRLIVLTKQ